MYKRSTNCKVILHYDGKLNISARVTVIGAVVAVVAIVVVLLLDQRFCVKIEI